MSDLTFHCDNGAIILPPKPELTREGFLRAYLRIAKTGDLRYRNADGTDRIERVKPEVLFHPDSMDSFAAKPITLLHPPKGIEVTPDNAATYQKGLLGHFPVQDGEFLGFGATITHRDAIDAALTKKIRQVSSGYLARVEKRSDGLFDQTWREGNHAAIVPAGRAGKLVSLQLDADSESELPATWQWQIDEIDEQYFQVSDAAIEALKDLQPRLIFDLKPKGKTLRKDKKSMTQLLIGKKLLRVDSEDAATLDALQSEVNAIIERADKAESDLTANQLKLDAATAQLETLTKERDALQAKVDAATVEPKADDAETEQKTDAGDLKERLQLIREVSPFLASELPEYKEDSLYELTPHEIKSAYLAVKRSDLKPKLDSASEDYVSALYDAQKPEPNAVGRNSTSRVDDILGKIAPAADAKQDAGYSKKGGRAERIRENGLKSMGMKK